ncbi:MAG: hypothetical protein L0H79_18505 [Intrasporangium sp.]|uniref:hypothetical protein n=1 Tax=Intrasporangium sp. TaxID=1925024 RepID=UPI002649875B|nr:hypothetical protein [Intrasporangium sp.]MDN5797719.1 hypothetical protein [Intrasporangium sp.]
MPSWGLSPDVAADLRPKATTDLPGPAVEAGVASAIPTGTLRGGPALDAAFANGGFRAKAYLVEGTDTVVLEALGQ